jgi:hypothetical protein
MNFVIEIEAEVELLPLYHDPLVEHARLLTEEHALVVATRERRILRISQSVQPRSLPCARSENFWTSITASVCRSGSFSTS